MINPITNPIILGKFNILAIKHPKLKTNANTTKDNIIVNICRNINIILDIINPFYYI